MAAGITVGLRDELVNDAQKWKRQQAFLRKILSMPYSWRGCSISGSDIIKQRNQVTIMNNDEEPLFSINNKLLTFADVMYFEVYLCKMKTIDLM